MPLAGVTRVASTKVCSTTPTRYVPMRAGSSGAAVATEGLAAPIAVPVSYTHLTLPTNREV